MDMRSSQNTEEAFIFGSFGSIFSVYNIFYLNSNDIPDFTGQLPGCRNMHINFQILSSHPCRRHQLFLL